MKAVRLFLLVLCALSIAACGKRDKVVAEAFYQKLYLSEVRQMLPDNLSPEDSEKMCQQIIDNWITKQVVLNAARNELSLREKSFVQEVKDYKDNLLMNAYFDKITSDSSLFQVSDNEVRQYIRKYSFHYAVEREIVKLNYIRVSHHSLLEPKVRKLLFDDNQRDAYRSELQALCADSIEYFLDDDTWLYLDEIGDDMPAGFFDNFVRNSEEQHIEIKDDQYTYFIVVWDYKTKHVKGDVNEEMKAARQMLIQQKKKEYIEKRIQELKKEIE